MNRPSEKARTLAHTTEAHAELDALMSCLVEAVKRTVEAYAAAKRAQRELVQANTQISGPEYVQQQVAS